MNVENNFLQYRRGKIHVLGKVKTMYVTFYKQYHSKRF